MPILLVDNSNTRTKFALASLGKHGKLDPEACPPEWTGVIDTAEISTETLSDCLSNITWEASVVSSVVPEKSQILRQFLSAKPHHFLSHQSKLPMGINYPKPEQIGADRLANAVAAHHHYGSPCIVLDFGTALTFDVITGGDNEVFYQGGVIAPGLMSMTDGLARRTALLPHITLSAPQQAIGKSTEQAMLAGAFHGYRGLIKEILAQLITEMNATPCIIATGGDAELIIEGLAEIHHLAPLLTLEGLRLIGELNL